MHASSASALILQEMKLAQVAGWNWSDDPTGNRMESQQGLNRLRKKAEFPMKSREEHPSEAKARSFYWVY
jgi:hypothetical protein